MVAIKLYQPESLVLNYFKSYGYKNAKTLSRMVSDFMTSHSDELTMDIILSRLDEKVYALSRQVLGRTTLNKDQQIGYFKMIFVLDNLSDEYAIFGQISDEMIKRLQKHYQKHIMQAAPQLAQSIMIPQKIKVYKPLLPLKKWFLDMKKKVKNYARK